MREWLGAMVTGGIVDYDPATATYTLPPARAAALTDGPMNLAPMAQFNTHLGKHLHQVARAFREGGGVPYAEFRPEFTDVMDGDQPLDVRLLAARRLPAARSGLVDASARRACASPTSRAEPGTRSVLLARAFPASTFVGFDLDDGAIARARAEARGAQLDNVTFEVSRRRAAGGRRARSTWCSSSTRSTTRSTRPPCSPHIYAALTPGGVFVMKEPHAADRLEDNIGNPMAPILYAVSTLHCMTVSLAYGGAGIGTMFGEAARPPTPRRRGFVDVQMHAAPGDPGDAVYVSRKAPHDRHDLAHCRLNECDVHALRSGVPYRGRGRHRVRRPRRDRHASFPGAPPASDASTAKISTYFHDHASGIKAQLFVGTLGIIALLWWFGALWRMLSRIEDERPQPRDRRRGLARRRRGTRDHVERDYCRRGHARRECGNDSAAVQRSRSSPWRPRDSRIALFLFASCAVLYRSRRGTSMDQLRRR